jgi:drug/metabolite transporter (DMT)-like permease
VMNIKSEKTLGYIYVLLAGIGFGFLGVFGRLAFRKGLSVGELLSWRFLFASVLLWILVFIFKRNFIFLPLKQIFISFALGSAGYAVFSTLYFMAIEGISVGLAALLLFTFPIFVSLGAHFFLNERMTRLQLKSLLLAMAGLIVLFSGPVFVNSMKSFAFALLAAITYAIYVLVSGRFQKGIAPISSSLYVISAAALTLILFHQPSISRLVSFSNSEYFIILGLATVCTIAPLTLFLAGLQKLSSSQASIVVMIEPVVAALASWLFLNENFTAIQCLGTALVLSALFLNGKKTDKIW